MSWTRSGECNGCGHCCATFGRTPIVRDLSRVADAAFYEARGFQPMTVDGRRVHVLWASLEAPCPQYQDGCTIYPERPATCQAFPEHPRDIVGTPCSYHFTQGAVAAGGDASPYPMTLDAYLALEATL